MPTWLITTVPLAQLVVMVVTAAMIIGTLRNTGTEVMLMLRELLAKVIDHSDRLARVESTQKLQEAEIVRARDRVDKALDKLG